MAGERLAGRERVLSGKFAGALENRRERALVSGNQFAGQADNPAGLFSQNMDRGDVWRDEKHGFDLESTMLRHADRLSRLTLAVSLLYVWFISAGPRTRSRMG